jgi:hypothetical protein
MEYEFPVPKEPFEIEEGHIGGIIKQVKQYKPPMLSLFDDVERDHLRHYYSPNDDNILRI